MCLYILFTEQFEVISLRGVTQLPILIHDVQLVDGVDIGADSLRHSIRIHGQLLHSNCTD